jgi:iron-sulfur cluster assembly accessory protein
LEIIMKITLTDAAAEQMAEFINADDKKTDITGIRISVRAGGCNGFKYDICIIDKPEDDDEIIPCQSGVICYIDPFSSSYLEGLVIDYVSSLQGSGFKFINPNETGHSCGCGKSVSL